MHFLILALCINKQKHYNEPNEIKAKAKRKNTKQETIEHCNKYNNEGSNSITFVTADEH